MAGVYSKYYESTIGACRKCNPKGFVRNGDAFTKCACHVEYGRLKKLHDSGLPRGYWDARTDKFIGDARAMEIVRKYIGSLGRNLDSGIGLYLHGEPGIGKTLLASFVVKACVEEGRSVKFYYFTDVLNKYTESWKDEATREELSRAIVGSDLLILDDLGREYRSNKKLHEAILDTVIRTRASQLKSVIITSNYDALDVKENYGKGILDLFREGLMDVKVTGDSYRRQKFDDKLGEAGGGPI